MSALDQIVNIIVSQQTAAVPQASFSIPLIVGPNAPRTLTYYTSAAAMLLDGFITSNPEYIYAVEAFSQALVPQQVGIGKRTTAVAQVSTVAVSTLLATGHNYTLTLNGNVLAHTSSSDTQQSILTALNVALAALPVPPATGVVAGTGAGALLTLTSVTPGAGLSFSAVDADLTVLTTTPNNGIVTDLNLILNAAQGNLWYGMAICNATSGDILQAAAFIETLRKIFIAASNDSGIPTSSTTDLGSELMGLGYKRTALVYSPLNYNAGIDAGWLGGQLPQVPGSSTWKFKQIVGSTPDVLTAAQRQFCLGVPGVSTGKTVNIYEAVGGVNITEEGWMCGGQFIDVTVGIDWLEVTMQNAIYTQLVNLPKIPFTDKGLAILENAVQQTLQLASDNGGSGLLDSTTIVVNAAKVSTIPQASRAARILPAGYLTFSARLAGAFHFITVNGTITV